METNALSVRERRREERRKQRAYERQLEERLLEETSAAMALAPTSSESETRQQPGAQSDGGEEAMAVALRRPNGDSISSQNKVVRWARDDEVIEIPRDDSDAADSQHVTTTHDNEFSEHHHASPRPGNNLSYVDGLFINAGAAVQSLTWSKTETNNHNHYYAQPQQQHPQESTTTEPTSNQDGVRQGTVSRMLQSPRFRRWAMYAFLVFVVCLVVCKSVSWACRVVVEMAILPLILAKVVGMGMMSVYHGTLGMVFSSPSSAITAPAPPKDTTTTTAGGTYHTAAVVISPLIPHLARLAGVAGQADLVSRETQSLLLLLPHNIGGGVTTEAGVAQISTVLEHLQTVQDETNAEWERHLRADLRTTRRTMVEVRRLEPEAERKAASWWWWMLCDALPPAPALAFSTRWCSGLPSRVVAVLDKAVDLGQGARQIREVYVKDGRILVSAHDVKEGLCRLHEQDVLGGMVNEVARQISSAQDEDGGGTGDTQQRGLDGNEEHDNMTKEQEEEEKKGNVGLGTATTERLRRAEIQLSDQRSGLRVNCMAASQVEAEVSLVRERLIAQIDALEEISDSLLWLRQSVVDKETSVPDAIAAGLELLTALEGELMRCA